MEKVKCPFCGYKMPVWIGPIAFGKDIWVKCKNRNCKREFEIKIEKGKQG